MDWTGLDVGTFGTGAGVGVTGFGVTTGLGVVGRAVTGPFVGGEVGTGGLRKGIAVPKGATGATVGM